MLYCPKHDYITRILECPECRMERLNKEIEFTNHDNPSRR